MAEDGHQCCCPDFTRKLMPPLWGQNRNEPWPRWAAWTFLEWHGGQLSSGGQWLHCSVIYCIYNENTEKQRTDSKCFYCKSISLQLSHAHTDIEQVNDVILAVKRSLQCKKKTKTKSNITSQPVWRGGMITTTTIFFSVSMWEFSEKNLNLSYNCMLSFSQTL